MAEASPNCPLAGEYDPAWDDICRSCGFDDPCGCPMDINTMAKMQCPSCGGQWWREHGSASTTCLHRHCWAEGSTVVREPLYEPHTGEAQRD